jgi:hypothetical protein
MTRLTDEQVIDEFQHIIGQQYSQAILREVQQESARPVRAGHYGTTDYCPERINLEMDEQDVIAGITFG